MAAKKKKIKKKKKLSADERKQLRIQRAQMREIRKIFTACGFKRIQSASNKEFVYDGTTSDFDDIYLNENIIVVAEYTTLKAGISDHLKKKKVLYDKLSSDPAKFATFLKSTLPEFKSAANAIYLPEHYRLAVIYSSLSPVKAELKAEVPSVKYLDYHIAKYFKALTDRVKRSAWCELIDFLGFSHSEFGSNIVSTATGSTVRYKGSILPEGHSHFPKGYKIVSFYVDPGTLLQRCYVLRKDGWSEESGLYQRMISKVKIESIRKYLLAEKRVFINNVIVTLPSGTQITNDQGSTVDTSTITKTEPANIQLPYEFNSIGLIDGQHRVFSYYEGGQNETDIGVLRSQQNLLVTGIIYPPDISKSDRAKFEATLFLEINATQTNAKSDLKQAIGLLLQPYSQDSIARQVVNSLNETGPLNGEFERYFFDKGKLKVTSVVSYGVKPIVRLGSDDTFFKVWKTDNKDDLQKAQDERRSVGKSDSLLGDYIAFCVGHINLFFGAVRASAASEKWTADKKVKGKLLSTTTVNGFIVCLRHMIKNGKLSSSVDAYKSKLVGIEKFPYTAYKSSQYGSLGEDLYKKFFDK